MSCSSRPPITTFPHWTTSVANCGPRLQKNRGAEHRVAQPVGSLCTLFLMSPRFLLFFFLLLLYYFLSEEFERKEPLGLFVNLFSSSTDLQENVVNRVNCPACFLLFLRWRMSDVLGNTTRLLFKQLWQEINATTCFCVCVCACVCGCFLLFNALNYTSSSEATGSSIIFLHVFMYMACWLCPS